MSSSFAVDLDDDDFSDSENCSEDSAFVDELKDYITEVNCGVDSSNCRSEIVTVEDDGYQFEVLTVERIAEYMSDTINEVNSIIQIPVTIVKILLHCYGWNKERLMESYYNDLQSDMLRKAHVIWPLPSDSSKHGKLSAEAVIDCEICFTPSRLASMSSLACEHFFCNDCWVIYLTSKVMVDGASLMTECPAAGCTIYVDELKIGELLSDKKVIEKYHLLVINSFIQSNRLFKWCPSNNCGKAIRVHHVEARAVKCTCGHIFCFKCRKSWHETVTCEIIRMWDKKCVDDSESSNWIDANTKECPKCHANIEKEGGCNHMICKNQNCRNEFCWVCLTAWDLHGSLWYKCNRFESEDSKHARTNQDKSRQALLRYLHYYNRYINHNKSLKLENKLYSMVKTKMEEIQQLNMSWIEVQFLKKAVDVLCDCRRTLMYTYVLAFYLEKSNQVDIFENNQNDLERATECLSEYLERDISADDLTSLKQKVQDKSRYCAGRRKVLLAHVMDGYDYETRSRDQCWTFLG